jgi:hypothetical protein
MDERSLAALQRLAGEGHNIPASLHYRLAGQDLGALEQDAARLARELGIVEPQLRDQGGRFASMSDAIRAAAGVPRDGAAQ